MQSDDKIKLVKIAYRNAEKLLRDVKENPPPMCGDMMQAIQDAHEIINDYGWLIENKEDLPQNIMDFIR